MKFFIVLWLFFMAACHSPQASQPKDLLIEKALDTLVIKPVWDINIGWQARYSDSLLEVCRPKTEDDRRFISVEARQDAVLNAKKVLNCQYHNDLIDIFHNWEKVVTGDTSHKRGGFCQQRPYQGSKSEEIRSGFSKAGISQLDYFFNEMYDSTINKLPSKSHEIFAFIDDPHVRASAEALTKRFGEDADGLQWQREQIRQEMNETKKQLITKKHLAIQCETVALIDGDTLLKKLHPEGDSEFSRKTATMILGRDAVDHGTGIPGGQRAGFGQPSINAYTYLINEGEAIHRAVVDLMTEPSLQAARGDEFSQIEVLIEKFRASNRISEMLYNFIGYLDPSRLRLTVKRIEKSEDAAPLHENIHNYISIHKLKGPYVEEEFETLNGIIQNLPEADRWQFEDRPYGGLSHREILDLWEYIVACRQASQGCKSPPEVPNRRTKEVFSDFGRTRVEQIISSYERLAATIKNTIP